MEITAQDFMSLKARMKIPTPTPLIKQRSGGTDRSGNEIILDYVEWYNYADALDAMCNSYWNVELLSMVHAGNNVCVGVRLTIDGYHVDNVGSEDVGHTDPAASAYAQAFKRCCAMIGLTRDLYSSKDDKEGLWKTVNKARNENIEKILELLNVKKLPKAQADRVKAMIDEGSMHYNASVRTVDYLLELSDKPKRKAKKPPEEPKGDEEQKSEASEETTE